MPGFRIGDAGVQHAGNDALDATAESKRKHRWAFTVFWGGDATMKRTSVYLQNAQRPHAIIEEAKIDHDQETVYFAGRYHWEALNLVFYDMAGDGKGGSSANAPDSAKSIYAWFNKVVQVPDATVATPASYKKNCTLNMTNGAGSPIEEWKIYHCWPIDVNWNEIDYTSTDIATIDVQMRFDRAVQSA